MKSEQEYEIESALYTTWQAIAIDILSVSNGTVSKEEVIEVVLDADRIEMFGNLSEETLSLWKTLSFTEKMNLAKSAFEHDAYGY